MARTLRCFWLLVLWLASGAGAALAAGEEVLRRLGESGVAFDAVPDLCEMSARRDPALRTLGLFLAGILNEEDERGRPLRDDSFLWLLNAHDEQVGFVLPGCERKESDRMEPPPEKAV